MVKGIDVSKWQGEIDWQRVKNSGVGFAMLRGGYGKGCLDACFEQNYSAAKEAGMPVGVYHYSYAQSVDEAEKEAQFCISYLQGKSFEYPVAFDIEDSSQSSLSNELLTQIALAFCDTVEKAGYYVCLYSSKSWLSAKFDMSVLSRFDVWLAQWNSEVTYSGEYGLWQYSSKGGIDGIGGNVDLDCAYKDYPAIMSSKNLNGFAVAVSAPAPAPSEQVKSVYSAGSTINLSNSPLYVSATASSPAAFKTGIFYIYDGIEINGRYRITNSAANVGKSPMAQFVTGWIGV